MGIPMKGYALLHKHLDDSIIEKIKNVGDSQGWESYKTEDSSYEYINFNIHRHAWLAGILMFIAKVENTNFGFDISSVNDIKLIRHNESDKTAMSHSVNWDKYPYQQKLTMIIQLSDNHNYEGGDVIFRDDCLNQVKDICKDKGSIIIFPSMTFHAIVPVISGNRLSLVVSIEGPAWR